MSRIEIKEEFKQLFYEDGRINYKLLAELGREDPSIFESVGRSIISRFLPRRGVDFNIKLKGRVELREGEKKITYTLSVCPECRSLIKAIVFERDGKVLIRKYCPDHGEFEDIYWSDAEFYYMKRREAADGRGILNPYVGVVNACPFNCGLCVRHKSHTALLNLVATNRCDLSCWYCFFFSERAGYVYEPSLEHIRYMLEAARKARPIPAIAVQITGGEPLLRDDIIEIIKIAKELGYQHVQLNTTGIRFVEEPELAIKIREAGVNTIYMSFDGVTPITNPKSHWEIPYILDALRKAHLGAVLVPTVIKTVNDYEVTKMILFGLKHNDIIRGVNFQPVSLVGRIPKNERNRLRVTIPDIVNRVEEETSGMIRKEDWYTVPFTIPISEFIEAVTGKPQFTMSNHFACGVATYLFQDQKTGLITPLPKFLDVGGFVDYLKELTEYIRKGGSKKLALLKLLAKIGKFIIWEHTPEQLKKRKRIYWMLFNIFARHNYHALGEFHLNTLFVGMMHFQDEYNYDVARIQRCDIHYVSPDGRLIPFCTFNVFPEIYRDRLQKIYSYSIKEYLEMNRLKSMSQIKYRRNIRKLESTELYRKTYEGFWDPSRLSYEEKKKISIRFGIPVIEQ